MTEVDNLPSCIRSQHLSTLVPMTTPDQRRPAERSSLSVPVDGGAIRARRYHMGLTVTELASGAEISKGYVSKIERGERDRVSRDVRDRLARVLRTKPKLIEQRQA